MVTRTAKKVSTKSGRKIDTTDLPAAPANFVAAFYANASEADLKSFGAGLRTYLASSMWQFASERRPGASKVRVFNPTDIDHTIIEAVNDDMPFLLDSIIDTVRRLKFVVHFVLHPVLQVQRDAQGHMLGVVRDINRVHAPAVKIDPKSMERSRICAESMIQVQIDRCLDPEMLAIIERDLNSTLNDVRSAVEDWPAMQQKMVEAVAHATAPKYQSSAATNVAEVREFLEWLNRNNFIYLGYREIILSLEGEKKSAPSRVATIQIDRKTGLGVLRDPDIHMFGGLRRLAKSQNPTLLRYVQQNHLLVVTKTNVLSRVHRAVPMDAIFIRRFDENGQIVGESLFVGLFTSQSYTQTSREIPFLRHKIADVCERAGFNPHGHDGRALMHILDAYPRDELFQIGEDELLANCLGILQLQERARAAAFVRIDPFERFVTCLLYVPRDRYDTTLRVRITALLEKAYAGSVRDWELRVDNGQTARIFTTIEVTPDAPRPNVANIENGLREICRSWGDRLRAALTNAHGEGLALELLRRYGDAFPVAYRESVDPYHAVQDIRDLERGRTQPGLIVDLLMDEDGQRLHLKLFQPERAITLSEALPLIENMGLKVTQMGGPYQIKPENGGGECVFIHEFVCLAAQPLTRDFSKIKPLFEDAYGKVSSGEIENDALNALTLRAGLAAEDIIILRSISRYLRQLRLRYSQEMIAATLLAYPEAARLIVALFTTRHDPDLKNNRVVVQRDIETKLAEQLAGIRTLEEDRIIRRYINLIQASLRTNHYQRQPDGQRKSYLSIKFDCKAVDFMPLPRPLYEIWVYSPRTEGVHLRGGKVARGGIRWSDRREDFRSEILNLMKAQMVKNTVIVPVGSKGGFIVKRPPAESEKMRDEGIECYKILMRGMLDITDNRTGNRIVPPPRVVRNDGDDPYLVVAADKGTATFSDIANSVSQEYGFWLDDAFASGGSAGYDHKGMGITARGAWEAVKRHFREMGKDIQSTDFTCIGVGDMSGDVFGNGMLLSKHIRLLGAFDHRHIFCDPNPDPAISFAERKRLFALPRSSWADYDSSKMSKGGGIFPRTEKSIKISPEMKKAYGITADSLAPTDLMQAMLKAEVELIYFGGIGTYVKSEDESHDDASDRANDAVRINGRDIRAKVIGEGANLGMTQRGRIEYALNGGRLNNDAIDNSAGVDTSDHEVNIKILMRDLAVNGGMSIPARNKLLASMTENVGELVLRDNYLQTQALSMLASQAVDFLPAHARCIQMLERTGLLNRSVEYLPDEGEIAERQRLGKGLTRPELAVLMAYTKIWLKPQLLATDLPEDPALRPDLQGYFPEALQKKYPAKIENHQLRREIIATQLVNDLVNRLGVAGTLATIERNGCSAEELARAYLIAREAFAADAIWPHIEALDGKIPADVQMRLILSVARTLVRVVNWILNPKQKAQHLAASPETYRRGVEHLQGWLAGRPHALGARALRQEAEWRAVGVPQAVARHINTLPFLATALDLTLLVSETGASFATAADTFFTVEQRLSLDWIKDHAAAMSISTPWQREALAGGIESLGRIHHRLAAKILGKISGKNQKKAEDNRLKAWMDTHSKTLAHYDVMLTEWRGQGVFDLAMLMLAKDCLETL